MVEGKRPLDPDGTGYLQVQEVLTMRTQKKPLARATREASARGLQRGNRREISMSETTIPQPLILSTLAASVGGQGHVGGLWAGRISLDQENGVLYGENSKTIIARPERLTRRVFHHILKPIFARDSGTREGREGMIALGKSLAIFRFKEAPPMRHHFPRFTPLPFHPGAARPLSLNNVGGAGHE